MSLITRDYDFNDVFEEVDYKVWKLTDFELPPSHLLKPFNDRLPAEEIGYIEIKKTDYVFLFYHIKEGNRVSGCFESLHSNNLFDALSEEIYPEDIYNHIVVDDDYEIYQFNQTYCSIEKIFKVRQRDAKLSFKSEEDFQHLIDRFDDDNDCYQLFTIPNCDNIVTLLEKIYINYYIPSYMIRLSKGKNQIPELYREFRIIIIANQEYQEYPKPDELNDEVFENMFKAFGIRLEYKRFRVIYTPNDCIIQMYKPSYDVRFVLHDEYIDCYVYSLNLKDKEILLRSCCSST